MSLTILIAAILITGCASVKKPDMPGETVPAVSKPSPERAHVAGKQVNCGVVFIYDNPFAVEVYIAGDFNNWNKDSTKMRKDESGVFKAKINIQPGTYQYKYVVDGDWITDPSNPDTTPDSYGGLNSVITVK
jgi:uncharacterized protein YceK